MQCRGPPAPVRTSGRSEEPRQHRTLFRSQVPAGTHQAAAGRAAQPRTNPVLTRELESEPCTHSPPSPLKGRQWPGHHWGLFHPRLWEAGDLILRVLTCAMAVAALPCPVLYSEGGGVQVPGKLRCQWVLAREAVRAPPPRCGQGGTATWSGTLPSGCGHDRRILKITLLASGAQPGCSLDSLRSLSKTPVNAWTPPQQPAFTGSG